MDLDLWLDQSLLLRQNQLKADFLSLFEAVANSVSNEELSQFFPGAKGKKISKGNQLEGFPYLVLDLIRDFDLRTGAVLRLVSWWGHGLYFCVFTGAELHLPTAYFLREGFRLGKTESPWDLSELILPGNSQSGLDKIDSQKGRCQVWFKKIILHPEQEANSMLLEREIRKILQLNLMWPEKI